MNTQQAYQYLAVELIILRNLSSTPGWMSSTSQQGLRTCAILNERLVGHE